MFGQAIAGAKGETSAANFVADHAEGKVSQAIAGFDNEQLPDDLDAIRLRGMMLLEAVRARRKA